jgi:hypothetical protein
MDMHRVSPLGDQHYFAHDQKTEELVPFASSREGDVDEASRFGS